jgi:hypothetical protein
MVEAVILSYALDTNGQNARYVEAARRWGDDEAVIRALALGKTDPAGVVGRYQEAARKHDIGLRIRSAHKARAYFDFPHDIEWSRRTEPQIKALAQDADIIHLNNSWVAADRFRLRKPTLLHHHGSMFRSNPPRLLDLARSRGWVQAVSTIDLQRPAPDLLHWLPTAYDIAALAAFGRENAREPDGRIRIGHFPSSDRSLKHTDLFVQVVRELQAEGLPIDIVPDGPWDDPKWLPGLRWADAMKVKASCDIVFDQLAYGYGCNSVEAWGMGKPVIAGADEWTLDRMESLWGYLPFAPATERTLKAKIAQHMDPNVRLMGSYFGEQHVLKYHDELPALTRLAELYHDAIAQRSQPRIQGKGVQFVSARKKVMTFDGQSVDFTTGAVTITDTAVVEKLRDTVKRRPSFGIEEVA